MCWDTSSGMFPEIIGCFLSGNPARADQTLTCVPAALVPHLVSRRSVVPLRVGWLLVLAVLVASLQLWLWMCLLLATAVQMVLATVINTCL